MAILQRIKTQGGFRLNEPRQSGRGHVKVKWYGDFFKICISDTHILTLQKDEAKNILSHIHVQDALDPDFKRIDDLIKTKGE
jgi:hypothetical protein